LPLDKMFFKKFVDNRTSENVEKIVREYEYLVRFICYKFRGRGEPVDDLVQVGMLGLMKSVENYDPSFDVEFTTYATPMIVGELRHYFRDYSRIVKLPRRIHELNVKIKKVVFEHHQSQRRSPTIAQISAAVGVSEDEIIEALEAGDAARAMSLDSPSFRSERSGEYSSHSAATLIDSLGVDSQSDQSINKEAILVVMEKVLSERELMIVRMRFYDNLSQNEIAHRVSMSQMHVSRIIRAALKKLRVELF
jgi:RNA polymerase sigma-B factor